MIHGIKENLVRKLETSNLVFYATGSQYIASEREFKETSDRDFFAESSVVLHTFLRDNFFTKVTFSPSMSSWSTEWMTTDPDAPYHDPSLIGVWERYCQGERTMIQIHEIKPEWMLAKIAVNTHFKLNPHYLLMVPKEHRKWVWRSHLLRERDFEDCGRR